MQAGIQPEPDRTRVSGLIAAVATEAVATDPSKGARTRRDLLRALFTLGVVAGTSAALAPILRAGRGAGPGADGEAVGAVAGGPARSAESEDDRAFEEMYRGRRIRIGRTGTAHPGSVTAVSAAPDVSALSPPSPPDIRIDGRPLQVMRRADGGYLSVVNHYESFPTPLAAARAAVRDLRGAQLALDGPVHHS
ncbi:tyrosinase family oxidase copper chaperone [Streptomyces sp. NPDC051662]|uniref:tyrosinase family oxidase copper chaperone n=1 Tax=Streptomyces sp. NPDC051662 TaxID=3154750 RepID=UPI003444791F